MRYYMYPFEINGISKFILWGISQILKVLYEVFSTPDAGEVCRAVKHLKNREPFLVRHEKNGRGERI